MNPAFSWTAVMRARYTDPAMSTAISRFPVPALDTLPEDVRARSRFAVG
jgi:hypothetical protein